MPQMHNQAKMEFIMSMYRLIFSLNSNDPGLFNSIQGVQPAAEWEPWLISCRGRLFKDSTTGIANLRGFDVSLNLDQTGPNGVIIPLNLRLLEQNPNKKDAHGNLKMYANLARQGHKIMWVINQDKQDGFLGRIQDEQWYKSQQFATRPAQVQTLTSTTTNTTVDQYDNPMAMENGQWVTTLPNIDRNATVEQVIECLDTEGSECQFVED